MFQTRLVDGAVQKYWQPFKTQEDFLKIPDTVKEAFFGGKLGGGKSDCLLMLPVVRNWINIPGFEGVIFRQSFPQLEESLIPRSKEYYYPIGGKYNESKHFWTFTCRDEDGRQTGVSYIRLLFLEDEADAREHDTAEFPYIGFDELTHFSWWVYSYMKTRNRTSIPNLPCIIRSASNPGNIGHGWVKKRFIDPEKHGYKLIIDHKTKERRIFIPSSLEDNIYIQNKDSYANSLKDLPEAEYKAKVLGDWEAFSGQVFEEFLKFPLDGDTSGKCHTCSAFEIPVWWKKFVSIDWGYVHPTVIHWFALAPTGRVYLYRRYAAKKQKVSQWASTFSLLSREEEYEFIKLDPSAWQNRGTEQTIAEEFQKYSGKTPTKADNDRLGGKLLLHEYLRLTPRARPEVSTEYDADFAQSLMRQGNMREFDVYMAQFTPVIQDENLPKLQIFEQFDEVCETLTTCVYDQDAKAKRAEDVKKWDATDETIGDDDYDTLRYGLKGIDKYIEEVESISKGLAKLGSIYADLETSGNQTAFYRRLESLERSNSPGRAKLYKSLGRSRPF